MLLASLLLAGIVQSPHAALHPADADLYAETPDVGAAVAAYSKAPLVQMVTGQGAASIATFAKELGFDIQSMLSSLLPVADPNRPDDRWWPWSAARRASFSASGLEQGSATSPISSPRGWMIVDFADAGAAAQAHSAILAMSGGAGTPAGELVLGASKAPILSVELPSFAASTPAWIARAEARVIVGIGDARAADLSARATEAEGGLASAWKAAAALESPRGVTILDGYSNLESTPTILADSELLALAATVAAPFLSGQGRWRIELVADRFVTTANYEPRGQAARLFSAFGTSPLGASPLAESASFVPPDAVGAWITNLNAAEVESALGVLFTSTLGEGTFPPPAAGAARLADGLGGAMAMSFLPIQSLMQPTPRVLLAMEIRDGARFQAGLDAWIERARVAKPDLSVERRPYRKVSVIVLGSSAEPEEVAGSSGSPLGGISLEPKNVSIAVLPDRVLFATTLPTARNEIKRVQELAEKGPRPMHESTQRIARTQDAIEVSSMDWGSFLAKVYDGARGFAPMLAQGRTEPMDLDSLPTGAQLFAPFRTSTSLARRVDGRILLRAESSFGPETPAALVALGFLVGSSGQMALGAPESASVGTRTERAIPAPDASTEPPQDDPRALTLAALRELRKSIAVYRSQTGRAPKSAADLLQGTDAFPDGFVKGGKLPLDGWGRSLVYSASDDGSSYSLHSPGPDGIDQNGAGDDIRLP